VEFAVNVGCRSFVCDGFWGAGKGRARQSQEWCRTHLVVGLMLERVGVLGLFGVRGRRVPQVRHGGVGGQVRACCAVAPAKGAAVGGGQVRSEGPREARSKGRD